MLNLTSHKLLLLCIFDESGIPFSRLLDLLQVETPVLETSAGGADARPFTTFHNALQQPYALRIATGEPTHAVAGLASIP